MMMHTIGARLRHARLKRGWTMERVAEGLGLKGHSTYSNWEYDNRKPDPEMLSKLASLFDVSIDYLVNGDSEKSQSAQNKSPLSNFPETSNISENRNRWNHERSQQIISDAVERMRIADKPPIGDFDLVAVPVLGVIRAGYDLYAEQQVIDVVGLPRNMVSDGEYFCLLVQGESMSGDDIHDGDIVVVKRQDFVDDGEIAVVIYNGDEATIKRIQVENDKAILLASNPEFPAKIVPLSDIRIQGQVSDYTIKKRRRP